MKIIQKPLVSFSVLGLLAISIFALSCKFSFADDKRPEKNSVTFGAERKPDIKTNPQFDAFKTVFADIAEEVIPTVVSITSTKYDTVTYQNPFNQWGSPFDEFFGAPRRGQPQQQPKEKTIPRTGVGSGVIVSPDGYILTNYHVVGEADEIMVELSDDREFDAEIVGIDSLSDVAVIKIKDVPKDLPVIYIGNNDKLRPGDWVMAIGNPFSLSSTVTTGIVSAVGRASVGRTTYRDFIQTDAAINPGNSGGALVNIDGELVGINTMIYTRSGGYMGIGFAIPINMAHWIMEEIIYNGEVRRGWLGVEIADIDQSKKEAMGLPTRKGVLINNVYDGQPAAKGGMQIGDVVLSIDGRRTENANSLMQTVASIKPGSKVDIEIIRGGEKKILKVTLSKRDEEAISKLRSTGAIDGAGDGSDGSMDYTEKLGISVGPLTDDVRSDLRLNNKVKGVVVTNVDQSSAAAREGIHENDVILKVAAKGQELKNISSVKDFESAVKDAKEGDAVMFYVRRDNRSFFVAFKVQ